MKLTIPALALLLIASTASSFADRSALIEHDDEWNLFTKFEISTSDLDEGNAILGALTIGGLLNDHLGLGISGHALVDSVETQSAALDDIGSGDLLYGGGYVEYVIAPYNLIYVSVDVLVGAGRLQVDSGGVEQDASFFVVEPGLNLLINITQTFHFGIGASYRYTDDIDIPGLEEDVLSDWSGRAFFRFTQF